MIPNGRGGGAGEKIVILCDILHLKKHQEMETSNGKPAAPPCMPSPPIPHTHTHSP